MLSEASVQLIETSTDWQRDRVAFFDLPEGAVVVKGQRPPRSPWLFRSLGALSSLARNPVLRPVPSPGGLLAQDIEVRRLAALGNDDVAVPRVLHRTDRYIVMNRVPGLSFQSLVSGQAQQALEAVDTALQALCELHRRGHYLSQAFARNLLWSDSRVYFIDFEDDPLQVMDLIDAQVRDLLLFMMSAVWNSKAPQEALIEVWRSALARSSPEIASNVRKTVASLVWLRRLPHRRRPWGRDIINVQALAEFMFRWIQSTPVDHHDTQEPPHARHH
jgi:tRNA A-37 threonylcarbamoyl transferase component Bud32